MGPFKIFKIEQWVKGLYFRISKEEDQDELARIWEEQVNMDRGEFGEFFISEVVAS